MQVVTKKLRFRDETIAQINKYVKQKTTDITYFEGNYTELIGSNIAVVNPNKILIKKGKIELMLLFYEQYDEDEKAFYIMTRDIKGSWIKVRELLKEV